MSAQGKVVWYDGMFLRPQHFQQQDRYLESLIRGRCGHLRSYDWGVLELVMDHQARKQGKIAIKKARGILPDGSPFNIPDDDEPPTPLDINPDWRDIDIFLVLPLSKDTGEVDREEGSGALSRYRAMLRNVRDLNVGCEDREQPVKIGSRQFCLLAEAQRNQGGYTRIAVAHVVKKRADQVVELDEDFIPPCLDCRCSPVIREFLAELQGLLNLCTRDLATRLQGTRPTGSEALDDLLMLQAANRYKLLFDHFGAMAHLHPEEFFRIALQLAGELATVTRESRLPHLELSPYDHDDLKGTLAPLMNEMRRSLEWRRQRVVIEIPIQDFGRGRHLAWIGEQYRNLLDQADFFLMVKVNEEQRQYFPNQCTISAPEELMDLVHRHRPGIPLHILPTIPPNLPFDRDFIYFGLQQDSDHWEKVKSSSEGIAFHVAGNFPDLNMKLYAIRQERP